jgi:predicted O-methyltransferase YrrM
MYKAWQMTSGTKNEQSHRLHPALGMDDEVMAVLGAYHERMAAEHQQRLATPPGARSADFLDRELLSVGPQTGQLINILARSLAAPRILELGTSYGYSGIWLAEAARASGGHVTTMELQDYKSAYARDMASRAGLEQHIEFKVGDAVDMIAGLPSGIDFVLVDLWKDLYTPCLEAFYPKLNPGAIIVADNMLRPGGPDLERYSAAIRSKPGITSVLLPVGTGLEVSRYQPA